MKNHSLPAKTKLLSANALLTRFICLFLMMGLLLAPFILAEKSSNELFRENMFSWIKQEFLSWLNISSPASFVSGVTPLNGSQFDLVDGHYNIINYGNISNFGSFNQSDLTYNFNQTVGLIHWNLTATGNLHPESWAYDVGIGTDDPSDILEVADGASSIFTVVRGTPGQAGVNTNSPNTEFTVIGNADISNNLGIGVDADNLVHNLSVNGNVNITGYVLSNNVNLTKWAFNQSAITTAVGDSLNISQINVTDVLWVNGVNASHWLFNQSNLKFNFNQSDLTFNFNQSDLTYNFNQSDLDSTYTSLATLQIVNDTVHFFNDTYNQFWFNQSNLDSVYLKLTGGNITGVLNVTNNLTIEREGIIIKGYTKSVGLDTPLHIRSNLDIYSNDITILTFGYDDGFIFGGVPFRFGWSNADKGNNWIYFDDGAGTYQNLRVGNMYASVFYDADDVNYYLNPASTTTSLLTAGSIDIRGGATFNDGGGDKDFRIESDNNVNLFVLDGGVDRIGIGIADPYIFTKLTIYHSENNSKFAVADVVNTTLTLASNSNTVSGVINNTVGIRLCPDIVSGSADCNYIMSRWLANNNNDLVFYHQANELMRITSAGYLGIGTTTPTHKLNVVGYANITQLAVNGSSGIPLYWDGGVLSTATSSESVKENIVPLISATEKTMALNPVSFNYLGSSENRNGLIYEEALQVSENFIYNISMPIYKTICNKTGEIDNSSGKEIEECNKVIDYYQDAVGIRWEDVTANNIKTLQEQELRIEALEDALCNLGQTQFCGGAK